MYPPTRTARSAGHPAQSQCGSAVETARRLWLNSTWSRDLSCNTTTTTSSYRCKIISASPSNADRQSAILKRVVKRKKWWREVCREKFVGLDLLSSWILVSHRRWLLLTLRVPALGFDSRAWTRFLPWIRNLGRTMHSLLIHAEIRLVYDHEIHCVRRIRAVGRSEKRVKFVITRTSIQLSSISCNIGPLNSGRTDNQYVSTIVPEPPWFKIARIWGSVRRELERSNRVPWNVVNVNMNSIYGVVTSIWSSPCKYWTEACLTPLHQFATQPNLTPKSWYHSKISWWSRKDARCKTPYPLWLPLILPALLNSLPHTFGIFSTVVLVQVRGLDICWRASIRIVEQTSLISIIR